MNKAIKGCCSSFIIQRSAFLPAAYCRLSTEFISHFALDDEAGHAHQGLTILGRRKDLQ